jgi:serine/threonine protein kinase
VVFTAGNILGDYLLVKKLAQGGMGDIFLAVNRQDTTAEKLLVLKVLREELAQDQSFVEMLTDEANVVRKLDQRNIVTFHDFGHQNKACFLVLEYIHGGSLEHLLSAHQRQSQKVDLAICMYVIGELCSALAYAHEARGEDGAPLNLVHRDVTPSNVLVSKDGEVKLTDFGLVRAKGRMTRTMPGILKGRFGYMAPEVMKYETIDGRADIFAIGVLLYEMLCGQGPIKDKAIATLVSVMENKDYPNPSVLNPHVPPALDDIVLKALEPHPDNRWQTASGMKEAVDSLMHSWKSTWPEADSGKQRLAQLIPMLFKDTVSPAVTQPQLESLLRRAASEERLEEGVLDSSEREWTEETENDETLVRSISSPALIDALSEMVASPQLLTASAASLPVQVSEMDDSEDCTLTGRADGESSPTIGLADPSNRGTQPVMASSVRPSEVNIVSSSRRRGSQSGMAQTFESIKSIDEASLIAQDALQQKSHLASIRDELSLRSPPEVAGWDIAISAHFSASRGGDIITKVTRPDGLSGLAFLQVVDGEPPPGLFTVKVASTFVACMAQSATLAGGVAWANRLLIRPSERRESVSACYFQFDETDSLIHYVNAGYPPPFFYKASDGQLFSLAGANQGLGTAENVKFEHRKVPVASGDIILIVTTGLLESKSADKELFGWNRAQENLLSAIDRPTAEIADQMIGAVESHSQGVPPSRDWAIVVLKKQ